LYLILALRANLRGTLRERRIHSGQCVQHLNPWEHMIARGEHTLQRGNLSIG
jgi:sarcosine oxidase delta subunit